MSQHHFTTIHEGIETHVLMGWDRPTKGFFMVIEKETDKDTEDYYFSNLYDEYNPHPGTLEPFIDFLNNVDLSIPESMIREVYEDGLKNMGNKEVLHELIDGEYRRTIL